MPLKVHLVVIDPQNDFMGNSDGSPYSVKLDNSTVLQASLPVPGATSDMERLAVMIDRVGKRFEDIHVTLDSHRVIDVGHPGMWRDSDGNSPPPLITVISEEDIAKRRWYPRIPAYEAILREYARKLAAQGNYPVVNIWPEHCLIGTWGHNVYPALAQALQRWERSQLANVDYVVKGTNALTEHYGALMAEVPDPNDASTILNTDFLQIMQDADIIGVGGEASSHCVLSTVRQIATHIGIDHVQKFHLLTDCMSPVPAVPGGGPSLDFPEIARAFFADMESKGMTLTTSDKFLA